MDSIVRPRLTSQSEIFGPDGIFAKILWPVFKTAVIHETRRSGRAEQTWPTTPPLNPTIIRRQIVSHFTTKVQDSLKKVKNSGRASAACSSDL